MFPQNQQPFNGQPSGPVMQPMTPPQPVQPTVDPGHGLGVAALILAFVVSPVGLILGIVGLNKSKKAGFKNGLALAGIIIGALSMVISTILIVTFTMAALNATNDVIDAVNQGTCTVTINGVKQDC